MRHPRLRWLAGAGAVALAAALAPNAQASSSAERVDGASAAQLDDRPVAGTGRGLRRQRPAALLRTANPMGSVKVAGVGVTIKVVQSNSTGKMTVKVN